MPTKRDLLAHLNRDELQDIVAHFGLPVDGRSNIALREAVAASKKAKLPPILGGYLRERLAELCEALSLESSGNKPALVERLTGKTPAAVAPVELVAPESDSPLAVGSSVVASEAEPVSSLVALVPALPSVPPSLPLSPLPHADRHSGATTHRMNREHLKNSKRTFGPLPTSCGPTPTLRPVNTARRCLG